MKLIFRCVLRVTFSQNFVPDIHSRIQKFIDFTIFINFSFKLICFRISVYISLICMLDFLPFIEINPKLLYTNMHKMVLLLFFHIGLAIQCVSEPRSYLVNYG